MIKRARALTLDTPLAKLDDLLLLARGKHQFWLLIFQKIGYRHLSHWILEFISDILRYNPWNSRITYSNPFILKCLVSKEFVSCLPEYDIHLCCCCPECSCSMCPPPTLQSYR